MQKSVFPWNRTLPGILPLLMVGFFSCTLAFRAVAALAAESVMLAWDANPEPDVVGYALHFGTSSGNYTGTIDAGNTTIATVPNLIVGNTYFFVVTSRNTAGLESFSSNEVPLTVEPPPTMVVTLTAPTNGTSFNGPANINLSATASATSGTVVKVEFYQGLNKLGEATSAPYTVVWNDAQPGNYLISAIAYDGGGATLASETASINLVPIGISTIKPQPDGSMQLTLTGAPGHRSSIFVSGDLKDWTLLTRVLNVTGTLLVPDPEAASAPQRFYRISIE